MYLQIKLSAYLISIASNTACAYKAVIVSMGSRLFVVRRRHFTFACTTRILVSRITSTAVTKNWDFSFPHKIEIGAAIHLKLQVSWHQTCLLDSRIGSRSFIKMLHVYSDTWNIELGDVFRIRYDDFHQIHDFSSVIP